MPQSVGATLPRITPIAPSRRPQPFNGPAWLFEPKYDGFRGVLYLTRKGCTFYSKRGNLMTRFRELAEQVRAELPRREVIVDGEIVAIDDAGRINFWDLMRGEGRLAYAAFDLLWLNGRDLRELSLTRRKKHLERLIPASVGALNRVPCFEAEGRELFEAACRLDLEGVVAKRKRDPTALRRHGTRSKIQPTRRQRGGENSSSGPCQSEIKRGSARHVAGLLANLFSTRPVDRLQLFARHAAICRTLSDERSIALLRLSGAGVCLDRSPGSPVLETYPGWALVPHLYRLRVASSIRARPEGRLVVSQQRGSVVLTEVATRIPIE